MITSARLSRFFDLRTGEGKLVLILWLRSFFMGATIVFSYTAANALFLSSFESSALPYVYIAAAIVIAGSGFLYSKLENRFSTTTLFIGVLLLLIVSILAIWLGLAIVGVAWLTFAAMIWFRLMMTLTSLEFWGLTGRLLTLRQGKRLYGLLGSGEVAARILGYFSVSILITWIGTEDLLVLAAISLVFSLLLLLYLIRSLVPRPETRRPNGPHIIESKQLPEPSPSLLKDHYVLAIFAISMAAVLSYYILDFGFYSQTKLHYQNADDLARFIALFFGIIYIFSFLFRALLTGAILRKFGVRIGLLILPVIVLGGALTIVIASSFTAGLGVIFFLLAITKLLDEMLRVAIQKPSMLLLYQPFDTGKRLTTHVAAESIAEPLAIGLAGLILILFSSITVFWLVHLALLLVGMAFIWIIVTLIANRFYPRVLMKALTKRWLSGERVTLNDEASIEVLRKQVENPDASAAAYSLRLLVEMDHQALPELLSIALQHPFGDVRCMALEFIDQQGLIQLLPEVRQRLDQDDNLVVRSTALRVLATLGGREMYKVVSPYLDNREAELRMGAMVGLLRSGNIEGVLSAGRSLLQLMQSPVATDRVQAAGVIQAVDIGYFYQPLRQLLADSDLTVRQAALAGAGRLQQPKLWPLVMERLREPETRAAAGNALAAGGETTLPFLDEAFDESGADAHYLHHIAHICGQIQGEQAIETLRKRITISNPDVRSSVLSALRRCGYQANGGDVELVNQQMFAETEKIANVLATKRDLGDQLELHLLQEALNIEITHTEARLFDLFSFLYPVASTRKVQENLYHPSPEKRSYALEVADLMLQAEHKRLVFPLLGETSVEIRLSGLKQQFPQPIHSRDERLMLIISEHTHFSIWTQACTLSAVGHLRVSSCQSAVAEVVSSANNLLSETATWAMSQLHASEPQQIDVRGTEKMLLMIEKVIILKTVDIFEGTPDDILAEIATLLEEVEADAGVTIFDKGDIGDSMYIIVNGEVDVHDEGRTLNKLGPRDVFGEMALLDAEPRMASISTLEDTLLLRLDQEPFYELMDDRIEIARGIIRVLLQRLRARVRDVNELSAQFKRLQ